MGRKRRRGETAPGPSLGAWDALYPSLDLHGETADTARRLAERWLRAQHEEGVPTVRIITGRGLHSRGPPVLRREIEDLLSALRGTVVSKFTSESQGGAFRIELRRRQAKISRRPDRQTAPSSRPLSLIDPELRRRAEESLWELGVDPTPQLIEAEVRRLRKEESEEGP